MQEVNYSNNPFPGLRPFEAAETHLFFGRDGQSEELLRRLRRTRFLAVVGTSGSGKSSLVRAGLLPALQGGLMASAGSDWRIAILRPGNDPIGNLARALASPTVLGSHGAKSAGMQEVVAETTLRRSSLGLTELVGRARAKRDKEGRPLFPDYENLLLVVDQFEEIFRFKQLIEEEKSKEDAAAFVKLLLEAAQQTHENIYVVLTMRSDFLGDCAQFQGLPEAINDGQYLIPRMTRDERRAAITGPIAVGEGAISEPLVNQLLNDVGDNPDQLPIMQHALMRTWGYWLGHRRDGEPMDIPDYEAIGGMSEALSRHADEAYEELSDAQKVIAEKMFKGLTEKGTDNREVRRPMEVGEICGLTGADEAAVVAVIEVFRRKGRSFLMPPPADALTGVPIPLTRESLVDISHESLIRNWVRLKKWVEEESRSARIYRRLAETAVLHREGVAGLWNDPDLQIALAWREQSSPNEVWARRYHPEFAAAIGFLEASVAARDARIADEEARRRKEIKRTRLTALIFGVAFLFSLAMGIYAYGKQKVAEQQKAIAEKAMADTELALTEANRQRVKAESAQMEADKQKDAALWARRVADVRANEASRSAKVAEQQRRAAEAAENQARANEKYALDREQEALAATKEAINQIGKNRKLLYSSNIGVAQKAIEDNNSERAQKLLEGLIFDPSKAFHFTVSNMMLSEDTTDLRGFEWHYLWRLAARHLATFEPGKVVRRTRAGATPRPSPETSIPLRPVKFESHSLSRFVTVGKNNVVSVWRYDALEKPEAILPASKAPVTDVAWLGQYEFATAEPEAVKIWSIDVLGREPAKLKQTIALKGADARTVLESQPNRIGIDSKLLAIGSSTAFMVWNVETNQLVTLREGLNKYPSISFVGGEDGKALITCDGEHLTRWDLATRRPSEIKLLGKTELMGDDQRSRGADERPLPPITSLAFTPDGKTMVTNGNEQFMVWAAANAEQTAYKLKARLYAHKEPAILRTYYDLVTAISPDGRLLATGDGTDLKNGGGVKLWDITGEAPKELFTLSPGVEYATTLAFTRDSRVLAIGGRAAVQLWDVSEKDPSDLLSFESKAAHAIFAPDGECFITIADNVVRWDVPTLEKWNGVDGSELDPNATSIFSDYIDFKGKPVALSPGGEIMATREDSKAVLNLWDTIGGNLRATIKGDVNGPVAFSPDKKSLATASTVDIVEWWDTSTNQSRGSQPRTWFSSPLAMAFSPDGKVLAVGGSSDEEDHGPLTLWNARSRQHEKLCDINGHEGVNVAVTSVAFSPNSEILATGGSDKTVELWGVKSHELIAILEGHTSPVTSVAFSPDGKTIASGDASGRVNLWNTVSHQLLLTLKASSTQIIAVAFSPSGNTLFTNDEKGEVRRWITAQRE